MKTPLSSLALLCLAMPLSAQMNPFANLSFEAALGQVRQQVAAAKAGQVQAKATLVEQDLRNLERSISRLDMDSWRWRNTLSDLRRRAQKVSEPQPGQPQDNDPFLRNDIQRFVWDLQRLSDDLRDHSRETARLAREAQKDPALLQSARNLQRTGQSLESNLRWLENDARFAEWDIRRAGFTFEAMDITRHVSDAFRNVQNLVNDAREIVRKVQS